MAKLNPLRIDPSRTTMLRRQFSGDVNRRFTNLRSAVWHYVLTNDMLALREPTTNEGHDVSDEARDDSGKWTDGGSSGKVSQTSTPAFKKWFSKSKVVDGDGKPLRVFHGTSGDFKEFTQGFKGAGGPDADQGFFFATSPDAAAEFTYREGDMKGIIMPVYLSIKNPATIDAAGEEYHDLVKWREAMVQAKEDGHDGFVVKNFKVFGRHKSDIWVAFDSHQIKSTLGNRGTFDPKDPIITNDGPPDEPRDEHGRWTGQTVTPAFKKWFGKSKVVDYDTGKPRVVYHGTAKDFNTFSTDKIGSTTDEGFFGRGFYFIDSTDWAGGYAEVAGEKTGGANIKPVFLAIKNPYIWTDADNPKFPEGLTSEEYRDKRIQWTKDFQDKLIKAGYDGIKVQPPGLPYAVTEWVAFHPHQIKSATGNRGTFDPKDEIITHAVPTANAPFIFATDDQKLKQFNRWLQRQINDGVLEIDPQSGEPKGMKPWMYKYVASAYKKGALRAYADVHPELSQPQPYYQGSREAFLESAFGRPERVAKLALLYTRSYENLKGITGAMAGQMSRVLADGMAHGKGAQSIARMLSNTITGISRTRALVLARTEIINAHAEGQLDSFEDLGVEKVGAEVEFTTSGDDGVCSRCEELDGEVFSIDEARGVIPVHPNCRCSWTASIKSWLKKNKIKVPTILTAKHTHNAGHDVSDEPRDESGKWTDGGGSGGSKTPQVGEGPNDYSWHRGEVEPMVSYGSNADGVRKSLLSSEVRAKAKFDKVNGEINELQKQWAEKYLSAMSIGDPWGAYPIRDSDSSPRRIMGMKNHQVVEVPEEIQTKMLAALDDAGKSADQVDAKLKQWEKAKKQVANARELAFKAVTKGNVTYGGVIHNYSSDDVVERQKGIEAFRKMIGTEQDYVGNKLTFYTPLEVIDKDDKGPVTALSFRSHYLWNACHMTKGASDAVVVHELGHAWEEKDPEVHRKALEFLARRTAGINTIPLNVAGLAAGAYGDDEVCKPDSFIDPYIGKVYQPRTDYKLDSNEPYAPTEVVSMGLELMYRDPVAFAKDDPDHFEFMYDLMHMHHRKNEAAEAAIRKSVTV